MRIQKPNNALYQSKVAVASGAVNAADISTLNSTITTVSGNLNTVSGNINTVSGNVNAVSGNVNTVSGNVNALNTLVKSNVGSTTLTDLSFSTTSSSAVAITGATIQVTKKAATKLVININVGIRSSTNTGSFINFWYKLNTGSWQSLHGGNVQYNTLNNLTSYEFNAIETTLGAGTYTIQLGIASSGTATVVTTQFAGFALEVPA